MFLLNGQDLPFDLEGQLVGKSYGSSTLVLQAIKTGFLVAVVDLVAGLPGDTVLIIGPSRFPQSQQQFASQTPGATTVEAVDLRDLTRFARNIDFNGSEALEESLQFASSLMTGVDRSQLLRRVQLLETGRNRKEPSVVEVTALAFKRDPGSTSLVGLLNALALQSGSRVFRPTIFKACVQALEMTGEIGFYDAAVRVREQNRVYGRSLPRRAVGSTLLLKRA
jgi:DNA helicase-2/ATP-dependent DNA helicase PcrA